MKGEAGLDPAAVASRIERIRKRLKLSPGEFAQFVGVHRNTLPLAKRTGTIPRAEVLARIARAGSVTVDWLLHGGRDRRPQPADPEWEEAVQALRTLWRDPPRRQLIVAAFKARRDRRPSPG